MEIGITSLILLIMMVILVTECCDPLKIITIVMVLFLSLGYITIEEAVAGFSNSAVLAIGALFILAGAVEQSVIFEKLTRFDHPKRKYKPEVLFSFITGLSAFLNNTPIVSIFIPIARRIGIKTDTSASQLLIPLSYLSMLGGVLTLVGTSTNLVVSGLMVELGMQPLGFFELTQVALPGVMIGFVYILITYRWRLPVIHEEHTVVKEIRKVEEISIKSTLKSLYPFIAFLGTVLMTMVFQMSILHAALVGIVFLLITDTIQIRDSLQMIEYKTICLIAISFSIGKAIINTGTAAFMGEHLVYYTSRWSPFWVLILVFIVTNVFTLMITNNVAAILAVPLVYEMVTLMNVDIRPMMLMTAIAASSSFLSPYGYQTNIMVYHAGGYRFKDFFHYGYPLTFLIMVVSALNIFIVFY